MTSQILYFLQFQLFSRMALHCCFRIRYRDRYVRYSNSVMRSKHALQSFTDRTSVLGNYTSPTEVTNALIFKVSMNDIHVN
jgi:hypothetical protein